MMRSYPHELDFEFSISIKGSVLYAKGRSLEDLSRHLITSLPLLMEGETVSPTSDYCVKNVIKTRLLKMLEKNPPFTISAAVAWDSKDESLSPAAKDQG